MTDVVLLNSKIKESGLKKKFLADKLGMTPQGFHKKTCGVGNSEFNSTQIQILCELLRITTKNEMKAIFFKPKVDE